jgi:type VI protein secretion system component Hcp
LRCPFLAISENPLLWDKYSVVQAENRLLFSGRDFENWELSEIRKDLNLLSPKVKKHIQILEEYLTSHLTLIPIEKKSTLLSYLTEKLENIINIR